MRDPRPPLSPEPGAEPPAASDALAHELPKIAEAVDDAAAVGSPRSGYRLVTSGRRTLLKVWWDDQDGNQPILPTVTFSVCATMAMSRIRHRAAREKPRHRCGGSTGVVSMAI
jgi:hypothetical protein